MSDAMVDIVYRLREWADNEEMIDQYYLQHGKDCLEAAEKIEAALAWDLRGETAELTEGEMLDLMVKALKGE